MMVLGRAAGGTSTGYLRLLTPVVAPKVMREVVGSTSDKNPHANKVLSC